jgi:hypothetical protein
MMVSQHFASCFLKPVVGKDPSSSSLIASTSAGTWKTSSFYLDSSGRSSISLPLELKFASKEALDEFLATKCIVPDPRNASIKEAAPEQGDPADADLTKDDTAGTTETNEEESSRWSFGIEAKVSLTFGTGEAISAMVEDIKVEASKVEGESIYFDTEIVVRVSRAGGDRLEPDDESRVKTNLEVSAVLSEKVKVVKEDAIALESLKTLNLGGFPDLGQSSSQRRVCLTRLAPFALHVSLTHALSISVKSVNTQTMGKTLVSLTMRHSNTHTEPVTVTNIALHPGHSREDTSQTDGDTPQAVLDMTKSFQWGYALKSAAHLPLTLKPHEAFSTIITVEAADDICSRKFIAPISVNAVVGKKDASIGVGSSTSYRYNVVVAADVQWMTTRAAVEPADAFRVDMTLQDMECVVGAPMEVSLDVRNLSSEERDLTLMIDHDSQNSFMALGYVHDGLMTVSEEHGQSFGVLGLSNDQGHAIPGGSDSDLLAVDIALVLGEMKGHASTTAKLRFIPLREGTLTVPFFKFVDKKSGVFYKCIHNLRIVAKRAAVA